MFGCAEHLRREVKFDAGGLDYVRRLYAFVYYNVFALFKALIYFAFGSVYVSQNVVNFLSFLRVSGRHKYNHGHFCVQTFALVQFVVLDALQIFKSHIFNVLVVQVERLSHQPYPVEPLRYVLFKASNFGVVQLLQILYLLALAYNFSVQTLGGQKGITPCVDSISRSVCALEFIRKVSLLVGLINHAVHLDNATTSTHQSALVLFGHQGIRFATIVALFVPQILLGLRNLILGRLLLPLFLPFSLFFSFLLQLVVKEGTHLFVFGRIWCAPCVV